MLCSDALKGPLQASPTFAASRTVNMSRGTHTIRTASGQFDTSKGKVTKIKSDFREDLCVD